MPTTSPMEPEAMDWSAAIALYHRGDWTLEELRAYAEQAALPPAAAKTVRAAIGLGAALRRKVRLAKRTKSVGDKTSETVPIERSPLARTRHMELTVTDVAAAAKGKKPSQELLDVCEAEGRCPSRKLRIHRYLTEGWTLVVSLTPHDDVVKVRCGRDRMVMAKGSFTLEVKDRASAAILDLTTRDITVEFRDKSVVTIVFA